MTVADAFAAAFARRDVDGLLACFTADASYGDLFLGVHRGAGELRAMFERMFRAPVASWDFDRVLAGSGLVIAEWRFLMTCRARRLGFGGTSVFELAPDGRCRAYREYFDRGAALAAMGTSPALLPRLLARHPSITVTPLTTRSPTLTPPTHSQVGDVAERRGVPDVSARRPTPGAPGRAT